MFQIPVGNEFLCRTSKDLLFLATPHEQSREWVPEALTRGLRVIDLSGAWRLNEAANRAVYAFEDEGSEKAAAIQAQAVYGLPELHRAQIADARLIANPGCYATSIILPLRPLVAAGLVDLDHGIVADAKSGVSGAGKSPTARTHFMYAADNLSAYGVFTHPHTGELLEQIGIDASEIGFFQRNPEGVFERVNDHQGSERVQAKLLAQVTAQRDAAFRLRVGLYD